jgi:prophage regulatory protein
MNVQTATPAAARRALSSARDTVESRANALPETGFIRAAQLCPGIVPIGRTTLWRKVKAGEFPAPVRLSANVVAWRVEDVRAWINSRA